MCQGEVGGVFALEASRLARNHRDWHHLIDLCVLTETVGVDAEGIYDPRLLTDRMLLGLKGTMSEFEIGSLRQRAREGSALLAGLLRCRQCGHKMRVGYRGGTEPSGRYYCAPGHREQGTLSCPCFAAFKVDRAVVDWVLETCQPLGIEASIQARDGNRSEQNHKRRMLELAVQRARYEVDRARRPYDAVNPANRLVAAELESRWNATLTPVAEAEARLQSEISSITTID